MAKHADTAEKQLNGTDLDALAADDNTPAEDAGFINDTVHEGDAAGEGDITGSDENDDQNADAQPAAVKRARSPVRYALVFGLVAVTALTGVVGWLSYHTYQLHRIDRQHQLFLQAGRQGALNLTTIDYTHADADVARILDSATGAFYDDFKKRAQPFIALVTKAQSKTEGSISEAGLESIRGHEAQVLVAVQVKTSLAGTADPQLRGWRMRLDVQEVGDTVKVSNVEFVP